MIERILAEIEGEKERQKEEWSTGQCFSNTEQVSYILGLRRAEKIIAEHLGEDIIRCRDCENWVDRFAGCTDKEKYCTVGHYKVPAGGYCVFGKKRKRTV